MKQHVLEAFVDAIRCPETGGTLDPFEPWLFGTSDQDLLFPSICKTPILQPGIDDFLCSQQWSICRAMAEFGESEEIRHWFFSRYGRMKFGEEPVIDTEVRGEGFPGFWAAVDTPDFLRPLCRSLPEDLIYAEVASSNFEMALDLGCGQGGMMQRMAANCRWVLGLEVNFYLAALANHHLPAKSIPVRYFDPRSGEHTHILEKQSHHHTLAVCGDIRQMPFAKGQFDWIHCGQLLDLLDDPQETLLTITELLKPGAVLTLCTPLDFESQDHFSEIPDILETRFSEVFQKDGIPWLRFNHKRRFVLHEDWIWIGKLRG